MEAAIVFHFLIISATFCGSNGVVPSYFKVCHRSDPQLGACVTNATYALLPRLREGISEYSIPKLEPLQLQTVNFTTGTDGARVRATIKNIVVYGGSTFKLLNVSINPHKNVFRFKVLVPRLQGKGVCDIDAKVLFLSIKGKGPAYVNGTELLGDCSLKANKVKRNGVEYLLFEKMKCQIDYKSVQVRIDNLFPDNPTLGQSTNKIINENVDVFIEALKPALLDAFTAVFTDVANKMSSKFSYNEFFPQ